MAVSVRLTVRSPNYSKMQISRHLCNFLKLRLTLYKQPLEEGGGNEWRDQSNQKPPFCQKPRGLSSSVWNPPSIHCQMLFGYVFRNPCQRLFEYLPSTCRLPSKQLQCVSPLPSSLSLGPQGLNTQSPSFHCAQWLSEPQLWYPPLGFAPLTTLCGLVEDAGHRLCTSESWVQPECRRLCLLLVWSMCSVRVRSLTCMLVYSFE